MQMLTIPFINVLHDLKSKMVKQASDWSRHATGSIYWSIVVILGEHGKWYLGDMLYIQRRFGGLDDLDSVQLELVYM